MTLLDLFGGKPTVTGGFEFVWIQVNNCPLHRVSRINHCLLNRVFNHCLQNRVSKIICGDHSFMHNATYQDKLAWSNEIYKLTFRQYKGRIRENMMYSNTNSLLQNRFNSGYHIHTHTQTHTHIHTYIYHMTAHITSPSTVCSTLCSILRQRKHQTPHYWPLMTETTRGFHSQRANNSESVSMP